MVNAKTKANLQSSAINKDTDSHCPKDYCLFNNTIVKVQTQEITIKDLQPKKLKANETKLAYTNVAEPLKQVKNNWNDKKKKFQERKKQKKTLAIGNKAIDASKKEKKRCNFSKVTCFNCNKTSYYASNCTKLKN